MGARDLRKPEYPVFSLAERDRRWQAARDIMDEENVAALLIAGDKSHGAPMCAPDTYLTNDRPGSWVVFPRDGEPTAFVWSAQVVAAHAEGARHGEASWISPANMRLGKTAPKVAEFLKDQGLDRKPIGVIGLDPVGVYRESFFSDYSWRSIKEALPDTEFRSVWSRFTKLMLVLGDEQISALRQAADAGEAMCEALVATARPGVSEAELYAVAMAECIRAGAHTAGLILQTGRNNTAWGQPNWTFRPQRPRLIEEGDIILAELFPSYGMVEAQQQLCIAVGDVSESHEKGAVAARQSYEAGLDVLRPGIAFSDLCKAMTEPIVQADGWFMTPLIHGLNPMAMLGDRYYKMENMENSNLYPEMDFLPIIGADVIIKPGMNFAFEPNCHLGHHRINIGGTVLVTNNGAEELNELANYMQRV